MTTPMTSTEKSKAFREKMAALGQKEMRGVWATDDEERVIKPKIRAMLKAMRKST